MSANKRVFSEQETSQILQRAAKLQEASTVGDYTPGVTRDELERIAAEAGIDPKYVSKALDDINTEEPKKGWLNLSEEYERVIEGEVDPDDYDEIFRDLRSSNNRMGFQQIGRSAMMQTFYKGAMCQVEVTSRHGRTRVRVKSIPLAAYFFSLHPALILGIITWANLGTKGYMLLGTLIFMAMMILGIAGFAGFVKKGHKSAAKLIDVLESRVEEYADQTRSNLAKATSKPIENLRDLAEQELGNQ
jgi:hypothetical protein